MGVLDYLRYQGAVTVPDTASDPDRAAEAMRLGGALNLPAEVVGQDIDQYRDMERRNRAAATLRSSTGLQRWLANPQNAAVAHDDVESLAWFEQLPSVTGLIYGVFDGMPDRQPDGTLKWNNEGGPIADAARALVAGGMRATGGVVSTSGDSLARSADKARQIFDIVDGLPEGLGPLSIGEAVGVNPRSVYRDFAVDYYTADAARRKEIRARWLAQEDTAASRLSSGMSLVERALQIPKSDTAQNFQDKLFGPKEMEFDEAIAIFASDPVGASAFISTVILESAPAMAAGIGTAAVTRSPVAGAAVMGAASMTTEVGSEIYSFLKEKGHDPTTPEGMRAALADAVVMAEARERGYTRGLIIGALDALSGGVAGYTLTNSRLGNIALQTLVQAAAGGGGEALAQYATDGRVDIRDVIVEALAEVGGAVVEVPGMRSANPALGGRTAADVLDDIDAAVDRSALASRSPEMFRDFLDTTRMGDVGVLVPADTVRTFYQDDIPFEDLGIDPDVFEDALASGGEVRISGADYATNVRGSEFASVLREHGRLTEDEMSVADAMRFNETWRDEVARMWEEDQAAAESDRESRAADVQIRESIFSQLRAAGRSPDVAEQEASLWSAFFRTMGQRYGEDALDLARQMSVRIEGPDAEQKRYLTEADVLLDTLREFGPPKDRPEPITLMEFVKRRGGIAIDPGEFPDAPPGLIADQSDPQMFGTVEGRRTPDKVAIEALENGYLPEFLGEHTQAFDGPRSDYAAALIEALQNEIAGTPQYSAEDLRVMQAFGAREKLEAISDDMRRLNLSLDMTNDEIVSALTQEGTETFEQGAPLYQSPLEVIEEYKKTYGGKRDDSPDWRDLSDDSSASSLVGAFESATSMDEIMAASDAWVLDRGAETGVEHLATMDANGMPIAIGSGISTFVGFPGYLYEAMTKGKVAYLTHNHPRNSSLSVQDYAMLGAARSEIAVMGAGGLRARARLTQGTLDALGRRSEKSAERFFRALNGFNDASISALRTMIDSGDVTVGAANVGLSGVIGVLLHRRGVIDLTGNVPKSLDDLGIDAEKIFALTDKETATHVRRLGLHGAEVRDQGGDFETGISAQAEPSGASLPESPEINTAGGNRKGRIRKADPRQLTLFQKAGGVRGSVSFPLEGVASGETIIRLSEDADLSTFLHESGHFFLEAFRNIAERPDAPQQMRDDLEAINKFLGHEGGAYQREQHETWARGFEAYAMEGNAPSLELASAFSRFKAWLVRIYRDLRGLNVKLTDEVREVMDRMLATDQEIATVRDALEMGPMFADPKAAGMTAAEWTPYKRIAERAQEKAERTLLSRMMEKIRREKQAWYKEERKSVMAQVSRMADRRKEYRLIDLMANRTWAGSDPEGLPDIRIDRDALVERYGEGVIPKINRQRFGGNRAIYAKGGVSPDFAADYFGFRDADEMIEVLINTMKKRDFIKAETDRIMTERHGDPLNDGSIEEEALAAIHSNQQAEVIATEARHIGKRAGKNVGGVSARVFRQRARAMLSRMRVADTSPARFLQASRQHAKSARLHFAKVAGAAISPNTEAMGNLEAAYRFKQQELLNHYLYMEARDLRDYVKRQRENLRKFEKKSVRKNISADHLDQIDSLLGQYDLRVRTNAQIENMASLKDYVQRMREEGRESELAIDQRILDNAEKTHFSRLSVDEFQGLVDTIANIEHMGRRWNRLENARRKRVLSESVGRVANAIRATAGTGNARKNTGISARFRGYANLLWSVDTIAVMYDQGEEFGAFYDEVKADIDMATADEQRMLHELAEKIEGLFSVYSRKDMARMQVKKMIEGGNGHSWSKAEILSVALNTGNADNLNRVLNPDAYEDVRLTRDQMDALLATLDKRDWEFVQSVWDAMEGYWPQLSEVETRRTGVRPRKVEATPVVTPFGTLRGGYYPISYNPALPGAAILDEQSGFDRFVTAGHGARAAVRNGMVKERVGAGGRTLFYDLNVIPSSMRDTVRLIALSEAVDNTNRILSRSRDAFLDAGRMEDWKLLNLWLRDVAEGHIPHSDPANVLARIAKNNFTLSRLAFNLKTIALQVTGIGQSAAVIGKRNMLRGMIDYSKHPVEVTEEIVARSSFMAERRNTFQKDMMDFVADESIVSPLSSRYQRGRQFIAQLGFAPIRRVQFHVVDIPTWLGAYQAALDAGKPEDVAAHQADRMVARSQASGLMPDRAAVERGTVSQTVRQADVVKVWTTLGSYMLAKMNRGRIEVARGARAAADPNASMGDRVGGVLNSASNLFLLYMFEAVMIGLAFELMDDDDEADDLAMFVLSETAIATVAGVPGLRESVAAARGFGGGGVIGAIFEAPGDLARQSVDLEMDAGMRRAIANFIGVTTGLPTTQSMRMIEAYIDPERSVADGLIGRNPLKD